MKIALSAAETSGDLIASSLVVALKQNQPNCEIDGLAGEKMLEAGCNRLWSCLLYTSPSPRDLSTSRMPSSA